MRIGVGILAVMLTISIAAKPVKSMLSANSIGRCGDGTNLPYDAEVEYLQSDGGQYIDTGIVLVGNSILLEMDMLRDSGMKQYGTFMGCKESGRGMTGFNNNGSYYIQFKAYDTSYQVINWSLWTSRSVIGIEVVNGTKNTLVDGAIVQSQSVTMSDYTQSCYLFSIRGVSADDGWFVGKVYSARISMGGVDVFSAIPVRVGSVGYMYDRVSGELFRNRGTGSFIIGPDKR